MKTMMLLCAKLTVYLDGLFAWLALSKLALNIPKSALNILVNYIDYQIILKNHIASKLS